MKATAFLVYRPVMDYEESLQPYLICDSKESAEAALGQIIKFMLRLTKRLPVYPSDENDPDGIEWQKVDDQRRETIASAKFPFGLDELSQDVPCAFGATEYDTSSVKFMRLPKIP